MGNQRRKAQVKFCHARMSSLLAETNCNSTITSFINARTLEVAKLITEEELLSDNIKVSTFINREHHHILRMCRISILNENYDEDFNDAHELEKNLATHNISESSTKDTTNDNPTKNQYSSQSDAPANPIALNFNFEFNNLKSLKKSSNNKAHADAQQDIINSLITIKNKAQQKLITIFNNITINLWNSKVDDRLDKIRNEIY